MLIILCFTTLLNTNLVLETEKKFDSVLDPDDIPTQIQISML